jgi:hypothetical protein
MSHLIMFAAGAVTGTFATAAALALLTGAGR